MIKSIAGLLSFLLVISTCYYLIFWSIFGVDISQYLEIQDVIKGVVYPMRSAIFLVTVMGGIASTALIFEVLKLNLGPPKAYYVEKEVQLLRGFIIAATVYIVVVSVAIHTDVYGGYHSISIKSLERLASLTQLVSFFFALAVYRLTNIYLETENNNEKSLLTRVMQMVGAKAGVSNIQPRYTYSMLTQYVSVGLFAYLLTSAVASGILNAEKIIHRTDYDYVTDMKSSLIPPRFSNGAIYLGAISTKLIFADTLMHSYFIVNADSVPSLHIHHRDITTERMHSPCIPCDSLPSKQRVSR